MLCYLPALAVTVVVYALMPQGLLRLGIVTVWMGLYTLVFVLLVQKNETVLSLLKQFFRRH